MAFRFTAATAPTSISSPLPAVGIMPAVTPEQFAAWPRERQVELFNYMGANIGLYASAAAGVDKAGAPSMATAEQSALGTGVSSDSQSLKSLEEEFERLPGIIREGYAGQSQRAGTWADTPEFKRGFESDVAAGTRGARQASLSRQNALRRTLGLPPLDNPLLNVDPSRGSPTAEGERRVSALAKQEAEPVKQVTDTATPQSQAQEEAKVGEDAVSTLKKTAAKPPARTRALKNRIGLSY